MADSLLNMSDEDIAKMDPATLVDTGTPAAVDPATVTDPVDPAESTDPAAPAASGDPVDPAVVVDPAAPATPDGGGVPGSEGEAKATDEQKSTPAAGSGEKAPDPAGTAADPAQAAEIDYKAEYAKIFAPFKANGKEIAVTSVDDAVSLMQMGANYNKKMAALKPNLKLMKMLENSGLLSEDRISYLIDLDKKDPAAISKLVKDSGLDPLDLDAEKASGYKPSTYTVDDREVELDTVLDEIQGTPTYNRTLEVVSTKWDGPSKQAIAGAPQLLKVINGHMQSGVYDVISAEIERERVFGRLNGMTDLEAYRHVGDAIQLRGGFAHLFQPNKEQTPKPLIVPPKPQVDEVALREKRRAASSTKPAGPGSASKDFNPLAMSDEDFGKVVNHKFL